MWLLQCHSLWPGGHSLYHNSITSCFELIGNTVFTTAIKYKMFPLEIILMKLKTTNFTKRIHSIFRSVLVLSLNGCKEDNMERMYEILCCRRHCGNLTAVFVFVNCKCLVFTCHLELPNCLSYLLTASFKVLDSPCGLMQSAGHAHQPLLLLAIPGRH